MLRVLTHRIKLTKTVRIEIVQVKWAVLYSYFEDRVDDFSPLEYEHAVSSRACVDVDSHSDQQEKKKKKTPWEKQEATDARIRLPVR